MKNLSNNIFSAGIRSLSIGVLLLFAYILIPKNALAQSCSSSTPAYTINLTGHPDTTWTSASVSRVGQCCLATGSDRCILFYITLDSLSAGIEVNAVGGLGGTDYTLNCDATTTTGLGTKTCISNPTTGFYVTICKPGGNPQQYTVKSIPKPYLVVNPENISPNCSTKLEIKGLIPSTVTWTSISGSAYNSNLVCPTSSCNTLTPKVKYTANFPAYVDYRVCGTPVSNCFGTSYCDTVRVYKYDTLKVKIDPSSAYICPGSSTAKITAKASGGKPPYTYSWASSTSTDSSRNVGVGSYTVTAKDALGCQVATKSVTVYAGTNPAPSITGSSLICIYEEGAYFTLPKANRSYSWSVSGGTITAGDGTNSIGVIWSSTGTKTITLTETNTISGCSGTFSKTVTVHPLPVTPPIQH